MEKKGLKMQVKVYWNSRKKNFSVMVGSKVFFRKDSLFLANCDFLVKEPARKKVNEEKRKNVHAFILGTLLDDDRDISNLRDGKSVSYNPYKNSSFVFSGDSILGDQEIRSAEVVHCQVVNKKPVVIAY